MHFSINETLSWHQVITESAPSTNVIDLGAARTPYGFARALGRDFGKGIDIPLWGSVTAAFNNLTSLTVSIQNSDAENFSSGIVTTWLRTFQLAELVPGLVILPDTVPLGTSKRYLRIFYEVVGAQPTTGKVSAGFVSGTHSNNGYLA